MGRRLRPSPRPAPAAHRGMGARARARRGRGAAPRGGAARHRARVPGRRRVLGLGARLGLDRLQPLASGSLRAHRHRVAARARRRAGGRRRGRAADPRARGRGVARGGRAAGRGLAVVPRDAGAARRGLGRVGPVDARAWRGEGPEFDGPHEPQADPRARARRADAPRRARDRRGGARGGAPMTTPRDTRVDASAERGIVRRGQPAADAAAPTPEDVVAGAALVREGRMFRLARERFPKMPLWPGHPTFEVVSYRTPHGSRVTEDHHWGLPNDACLGFMSELVIGTTHSGAHIDAHAHMTVGGEDRWHGGSARTDLGDFGPVVGDATEIPPLWRRGVLYDVPAHRGVEALPAGDPITADELLAIERETGLAARPGDVALVRTGYPSPWPSCSPSSASRRWPGARATSRSCARPTSPAGGTPTASPRAAVPGPTSRPRGCCSSAGSSPSGPTPRPTRSSRRPTAASRRTR